MPRRRCRRTKNTSAFDYSCFFSNSDDVYVILYTLYDDLDPVFETVDDVEAFLLDEHNWISQKVCTKLFARVRLHAGDNEIARDIDRESIRYRSFGYLENIFIKAIGHPYSLHSALRYLKIDCVRTGK